MQVELARSNRSQHTLSTDTAEGDRGPHPSSQSLPKDIVSYDAEQKVAGPDDDGALEPMKQLLAIGVDPNDGDERGATAVHWAALNRKPQHLRLLHANRGDLTRRDDDGFTPMTYAAIGKNFPNMRFLRDHKADVTEADPACVTQFHVLAAIGRTASLERLAESGVDIVAADKNDSTPLMYAQGAGNDENAQWLLARIEGSKVGQAQ